MIVGVFVKHGDKVYTLLKPNRHHDVIRKIYEETGESNYADPMFGQGFIDENGKLYSRKAALGHAIEHKQLLPRATCAGKRLFSEDVW